MWNPHFSHVEGGGGGEGEFPSFKRKRREKKGWGEALQVLLYETQTFLYPWFSDIVARSSGHVGTRGRDGWKRVHTARLYPE